MKFRYAISSSRGIKVSPNGLFSAYWTIVLGPLGGNAGWWLSILTRFTGRLME